MVDTKKESSVSTRAPTRPPSTNTRTVLAFGISSIHACQTQHISICIAGTSLPRGMRPPQSQLRAA